MVAEPVQPIRTAPCSDPTRGAQPVYRSPSTTLGISQTLSLYKRANRSWLGELTSTVVLILHSDFTFPKHFRYDSQPFDGER